MNFEPMKILIVDPDEVVVKPLRDALIKRGFRVGHVANGEMAFQICEKSIPTAIITEAVLPDMNGEDFLRRLQRKKSARNVSVIFISEQKMLDDRIIVIELGGDDYVSKPFDADEVVTRLELLIDEKEAVHHDWLQQNPEKSFSGTLSEMNLLDLIEIFEVASKSGILRLRRNGKEGHVLLADGEVLDAEANGRSAEEAIDIMLTWSDGYFNAEFHQVSHKRNLSLSTKDLLSKAALRLSRWTELTDAVPPLNVVIERNAQMPDDIELTNNEEKALAQLDSPRTIIKVIDAMRCDPLQAIIAVRGLFEKEAIIQSGQTQSVNDGTMPKKDFRSKTDLTRKEEIMSRIASLFEIGDTASVSSINGDSEDSIRNRTISNNRHRRKSLHPLTRTELLLIRERLL